MVLALGAVVAAAVGGARALDRPKLAADTQGRAVWPQTGDGMARLHNGWTLNPAGYSTETSDMPSMATLSPDGKWVLVATSGYKNHTVYAFEIGNSPDRNVGSDTRFPTNWAHSVTLSHAYRSMRFGKGENSKFIYVSGGTRGFIWRLRFEPTGVGLTVDGTIPVRSGAKKAFVGGMDVLPDGRIVVVDEAGDPDTALILDPNTGKELARAQLTMDAGAVACTPDGKKVYIAEHGTGRVLVRSGSDLSAVGEIEVGSQPNDLLADSRGRLFVANTGSDTVTVVDTKTDRPVETIRTSLTSKAPLGSIPNALAESADGKTLYVTNGGNNDVAVVRLGEEGSASQVLGFVPTGWYPVSVVAAPKGDWLFVGSGKGLGSHPNSTVQSGGVAVRSNQPVGQAYGPNHDRNVYHDYILSTISGAVSRIPVPTEAELKRHTEVVLASSPYRDENLVAMASRPKNSVLPASHTGRSPFKHVLYIIKENRTYDQVLGDIKKGNGDPNLVLFGPKVTPNHHRMAEQFVLLDNTYCDGEVSQDGWEWSTAALDSDWDTKATVFGYSGRGNMPGSRETIRPANGYIWEAARKRGLTVFSYGAKTFGGLFSPTWEGAFSKEWNQARSDSVPDYKKADIFIEDLKKAEQTGKWPNLVLMSLADDHTSGTRPGAATPYAAVGSNDLAIGKVVEAVTHSRFWPETAIFIIEDDAQNGPDHVDAHRTVALVVSPYTPRKSLDSTLYSSSSLVRSIGLALGIGPLSQYDAGSNPMYRCFTGKRDLTPYTCVTPKVDLDAKNTKESTLAALSAKLDWSDVDRADFATLNHILWAELRPGEPYPTPRRAYRPNAKAEEADRDDD